MNIWGDIGTSLGQLERQLEHVNKLLCGILIHITEEGHVHEHLHNLTVINNSGRMVRWRIQRITELLNMLEGITYLVPPVQGAVDPRGFSKPGTVKELTLTSEQISKIAELVREDQERNR